jgi:hypothetical protein
METLIAMPLLLSTYVTTNNLNINLSATQLLTRYISSLPSSNDDGKTVKYEYPSPRSGHVAGIIYKINLNRKWF